MKMDLGTFWTFSKKSQWKLVANKNVPIWSKLRLFLSTLKGKKNLFRAQFVRSFAISYLKVEIFAKHLEIVADKFSFKLNLSTNEIDVEVLDLAHQLDEIGTVRSMFLKQNHHWNSPE